MVVDDYSKPTCIKYLALPGALLQRLAVAGRGMHSFDTAWRMREQGCDSGVHTRPLLMALFVTMLATTTLATTATQMPAAAGEGEEKGVLVLG